jgi:chaperonin GroEL
MSEKETKVCLSDRLYDNLLEVYDRASVVTKTSGPGGLCIAIESSYGEPKITKDGYSIIKSYQFPKELESLSTSFIKTPVEKTNKEAGDGTTLAFNIGHKAAKELFKLRKAGVNNIDIKAGYDEATKLIQETLSKIARKININSNEIEKIATISANGDHIVGSIIADAMKKVGAEGVITVEDSKSSEKIGLELKTGMHLDRGFLSPYFVTNTEKMICELEDPYILITSKKITSIHQILNLIESIAKTGKPLFIIADDVEGEALSVLILNRLRGTLKVCAIKAPGFGDKRTEILKDIAILTNGQVIVDETGESLEDLTLIPGVIGIAKRITVHKESTIIVGGSGEKSEIDSRTCFIKNQIAETTSDYEKEKLQERLAKLSGGVAVIKVGGTTELEVKELKDRIEDALNATRAAVADGIVPGGGVTQLAIAYVLRAEIDKNNKLTREAKLVAEKILDAFAINIRHIVENTGRSADVVINKLQEQFEKDKLSIDNLKISMVYDALTGHYVRAYENIIDPAKVLKVAFMNAINTIYMLLMTEGAVYFRRDECPCKSDAPMPGGGMGGMGGMDY